MTEGLRVMDAPSWLQSPGHLQTHPQYVQGPRQLLPYKVLQKCISRALSLPLPPPASKQSGSVQNSYKAEAGLSPN